MTFKGAHLKLTLWYLLIVMFISVTFSIIVYSVSFHEIRIINNNQSNILRRGSKESKIIPPNIPFENAPLGLSVDEFEKYREQQLIELKTNLIKNLTFVNLSIFILAGLASYAFAQKTLKPIEEMVDKQNSFTADASHELRTPLAAMKIEIEVALRDKKITIIEAKKLLKSNLEEIDKLENLSNGLLELAQYQINQNKNNFNKFNLNEVIDEVMIRFLPIAQKKHIKIKQNTKEILVKGDRDKLAQLTSILLDNAIKYSPDGSSIWLKALIENKNALIIVKDQGIGIKASDLPYIYNRFYRVDQSRSKEKHPGYGLGLAIAKQIVSFHKGVISVESSPNEGTTFTIRIPLS